VAYVYLPS